ncbi:hypothetical protein WG947_01655 [Pontibacter sp. H259]|uniref:DUF7684 family protein n=1 Tax=Pontibacter sp. H259 TaxID=3133421 RepID=UPI0030C5D243
MKRLGTVDGKAILYQKHDTSVNWAKVMPTENWLLMIIADEKPSTVLIEIARKSINRGVCYVCCLSSQAEKQHDIFREDIDVREVEIENNYLPGYEIMTTWHRDFSEGVWFAMYLAWHEEQEINTIFCLNAGKEDSEEVILELINKINQGWVPIDKK